MRPLNIVLLAAALSSAVAGVGCGKANAHEGKQTANATPQAQEVAPVVPSYAPVPVEAPKPARHVELEIGTVANTMTFDKTKLSVPAGAEVHLVIKNNATVATLPHNWVLVKPGTEASVAAAGLKLGDPAGYFDVRDKDALAHTPMAKPGESSELTFTAPVEPGDYPYICTVPGHYMMMKGVLTVTP
ncbi:MAG: plastocyanin/azurin family copper-binding protein [Myxococcota bacterium]|nr:plastocyanin/azurin family copper-binding protein [Myxococcota bacterium]